MSVDIIPTTVEKTIVESPEKRAQRVSTGVLITVIGLLLLAMAFTVAESGLIALSDAFADVKLPTIEVPGTATVVVCALLVLGAGVGFLSGRLSPRLRTAAGVAAGVGVLVGAGLLGERYPASVWVGVGLIALGIGLTVWARRKG